MRTLLELHYDEVHFSQWHATHGAGQRPAERKGTHKVFGGAARAHRLRLNQRLELPPAVKEIFKKPEDEFRWEALDALRAQIIFEAEGHTTCILQSEDVIDRLADIIQTGTGKHVEEVGDVIASGHRIKKHMWLRAPEPLKGGLGKKRTALAKSIRNMCPGASIGLVTRPWRSKRRMSLDRLGKALFGPRTLREIAGALSIEELLDRMLLVLWDALFLNQCKEPWHSGLLCARSPNKRMPGT